MTVEFRLHDVGQGQLAALRLVSGQWCIFDAGKRNTQSGIDMIYLGEMLRSRNFTIRKATISHLHGDHLADYRQLLHYSPQFLRTVEPDSQHLADLAESNTKDSLNNIIGFLACVRDRYTSRGRPDFAPVTIRERSLSLQEGRNIGGDANTRVNNSSIVSRIDCYENSILICGDVEKNGWQYALTQCQFYLDWQQFVRDVDILIAPHHGHSSAYSIALMNLARPKVVLISVKERDPSVDSRYSSSPVQGITIGNETHHYISTRDKGDIHVTIHPPIEFFQYGKGLVTWEFSR